MIRIKNAYINPTEGYVEFTCMYDIVEYPPEILMFDEMRISLNDVSNLDYTLHTGYGDIGTRKENERFGTILTNDGQFVANADNVIRVTIENYNDSNLNICADNNTSKWAKLDQFHGVFWLTLSGNSGKANVTVPVYNFDELYLIKYDLLINKCVPCDDTKQYRKLLKLMFLESQMRHAVSVLDYESVLKYYNDILRLVGKSCNNRIPGFPKINKCSNGSCCL
jgi:hypothetical protein